MIKNLLIGDTTYPHTTEATLSARLRNMKLAPYEAAERIEQLELAVRHRDAVINELESQLSAKKTIECEEFYNLMQAYRHSDLAKKYLMIDETIAAYYAVINYVDAAIQEGK